MPKTIIISGSGEVEVPVLGCYTEHSPSKKDGMCATPESGCFHREDCMSSPKRRVTRRGGGSDNIPGVMEGGVPNRRSS